MAKLYGKSKVTKGIVKLTWKKDKLRIETCEEWKILMGYLFLNAEETQVYWEKAQWDISIKQKIQVIDGNDILVFIFCDSALIIGL